MKLFFIFYFFTYLLFGARGDHYLIQAKEAYNKSDYKKAKQYYRKACNIGNMLGCSGLGTIYERGLDVEQSYKKARKYYRFSCKNGDHFGCFHLRLLENGPKAEEYYDAMCDEEDGISCQRLADLYYKGLGVSKNLQNAAYYYQRACSFLIAESCFNLGVMYENGEGTLKKSPEIALAYFYLAKDYFEKECQKGKNDSCSILNNIDYFQD